MSEKRLITFLPKWASGGQSELVFRGWAASSIGGATLLLTEPDRAPVTVGRKQNWKVPSPQHQHINI